jgi:hypothetical protein
MRDHKMSFIPKLMDLPMPRPEGLSNGCTLGSWPPAVDRQVKGLSIFADVAGLTATGAV